MKLISDNKEIRQKGEGELKLKRLKYYILNMKPDSETYEDMYEGKMYESFMDKNPIVL